MTRSVVVVGGGVAGLAAAYELAKLQREGADLTFTIIERSNSLGGILATVRHSGFVVECGPDGWVSEKPWASDLAKELGLQDGLIYSNDAERVTYVLRNGRLQPMPDGMRMMVPSSLESLQGTPLFSDAARAAYAAELQRAEELKRIAPAHDESVAEFVRRHFGKEVLRVIGAPLLGGVFGGDVQQLSVRAVMKPFVEMEREHGSLIAAVQARNEQHRREGKPRRPIFTSLRNGTGALAEAMAATLPDESVHLSCEATKIARTEAGWSVSAVERSALTQTFEANALLLATPVHRTETLLRSIDAEAANLLGMPASSAVIAVFCFLPEQPVRWPKGFGFLAPAGEGSRLLAGTFSDQKYSHRVPDGGHMVRAYFGGAEADALIPQSGETIVTVAREELQKVLGLLPNPAFTVVRRWPNALPQYGVGHLERMEELDRRIASLPGLALLGNGYRGVGLPELIRDGRAAARRSICVLNQ